MQNLFNDEVLFQGVYSKISSYKDIGLLSSKYKDKEVKQNNEFLELCEDVINKIKSCVKPIAYRDIMIKKIQYILKYGTCTKIEFGQSTVIDIAITNNDHSFVSTITIDESKITIKTSDYNNKNNLTECIIFDCNKNIVEKYQLLKRPYTENGQDFLKSTINKTSRKFNDSEIEIERNNFVCNTTYLIQNDVYKRLNTSYQKDDKSRNLNDDSIILGKIESVDIDYVNNSKKQNKQSYISRISCPSNIFLDSEQFKVIVSKKKLNKIISGKVNAESIISEAEKVYTFGQVTEISSEKKLKLSPNENIKLNPVKIDLN